MNGYKNRTKHYLSTFLLTIMMTITGCASAFTPVEQKVPLMLNEPLRPQYHFTPPAHWMNDPNGLVYYEGEYHLFYQHNPDDTVWGPMHWGHAVSPDLVNWTHLPIALYPDEIGMIFSGSVMIDWHNTAGFGREAMVAFFTHEANGRQMQSIAYSTDKGRTWTKYEGNPVIEPPNNIRNFRDPKVIWYDQGETGHWVMVVVAGTIVLFYTSPDLINWTASGGFGLTYGATCGVWETPDLFELPVDGGPDMRWVLAVAIGDCAPAGGSGMQYFVGAFDGQVFTSENDKDTVLWADFGADFYAPQSWSEAPDGRRIWVAWMNNWGYANQIPASTWRGALTLPRELSLTQTPAGIRLVQQPVGELQQLRGREHAWHNQTISPNSHLWTDVQGDTLEILAEFRVEAGMEADRFGFRVRVGAAEMTTIGYAIKEGKVFVDRSQSGQTDFHELFAAVHWTDMRPQNGLIRLHIFVDRTSVELFGNGGLVQITDQIFPESGSLGVEIFADGGPVHVNSVTIYELAAAAFFTATEGETTP